MKITLLAALVLIAVAGCTDRPGSPTSPTAAAGGTPRYSELGGGCTETMVICDDGSEPPRWTDDGFEEVYTEAADGDLSFDDGTGESTSGGGSARCPSYVVGVAYANVYVTNPGGEKTSVRFMSRGTWSWMADIGPNMARYNWPPGYWDAVDGSGIQVQVGSVEGICRMNDRGLVYVSFTGKFYHVNARFPRRRGYYLASSGGGGDEPQCRQEYVYVEINYGDGSGWHVIWEGTAPRATNGQQGASHASCLDACRIRDRPAWARPVVALRSRSRRHARGSRRSTADRACTRAGPPSAGGHPAGA